MESTKMVEGVAALTGAAEAWIRPTRKCGSRGAGSSPQAELDKTRTAAR